MDLHRLMLLVMVYFPPPSFSYDSDELKCGQPNKNAKLLLSREVDLSLEEIQHLLLGDLFTEIYKKELDHSEYKTIASSYIDVVLQKWRHDGRGTLTRNVTYNKAEPIIGTFKITEIQSCNVNKTSMEMRKTILNNNRISSSAFIKILYCIDAISNERTRIAVSVMVVMEGTFMRILRGMIEPKMIKGMSNHYRALNYTMELLVKQKTTRTTIVQSTTTTAKSTATTTQSISSTTHSTIMTTPSITTTTSATSTATSATAISKDYTTTAPEVIPSKWTGHQATRTSHEVSPTTERVTITMQLPLDPPEASTIAQAPVVTTSATNTLKSPTVAVVDETQQLQDKLRWARIYCFVALAIAVGLYICTFFARKAYEHHLEMDGEELRPAFTFSMSELHTTHDGDISTRQNHLQNSQDPPEINIAIDIEHPTTHAVELVAQSSDDDKETTIVYRSQ